MAQILHSTFENFHAIDNVPPVKRREYKAYCTSKQCTKTPSYCNLRYVHKPNAKRGSIFCPDCNYALYWSHLDKVI